MPPVTPDNAGYAYAAYIAAVLILGGYTVSLLLRARRVRERARSMLGAVGERAGAEAVAGERRDRVAGGVSPTPGGAPPPLENLRPGA